VKLNHEEVFKKKFNGNGNANEGVSGRNCKVCCIQNGGKSTVYTFFEDPKLKYCIRMRPNDHYQVIQYLRRRYGQQTQELEYWLTDKLEIDVGTLGQLQKKWLNNEMDDGIGTRQPGRAINGSGVFLFFTVVYSFITVVYHSRTVFEVLRGRVRQSS